MSKRGMRIVNHFGVVPCAAICTYCSQQFKIPSTAIIGVMDAVDILQQQFNVHKCKREDVNQTAARIVRESTQDK
jgi:hypothetical protein